MCCVAGKGPAGGWARPEALLTEGQQRASGNRVGTLVRQWSEGRAAGGWWWWCRAGGTDSEGRAPAGAGCTTGTRGPSPLGWGHAQGCSLCLRAFVPVFPDFVF